MASWYHCVVLGLLLSVSLHATDDDDEDFEQVSKPFESADDETPPRDSNSDDELTNLVEAVDHRLERESDNGNAAAADDGLGDPFNDPLVWEQLNKLKTPSWKDMPPFSCTKDDAACNNLMNTVPSMGSTWMNLIYWNAMFMVHGPHNEAMLGRFGLHGPSDYSLLAHGFMGMWNPFAMMGTN